MRILFPLTQKEIGLGKSLGEIVVDAEILITLKIVLGFVLEEMHSSESGLEGRIC